MSDTSSIVQILFSVMGAEAVTGAMSNIQAGSANLGGELLRLGGVALTLNAAMDGLKGAIDLGVDMVILSTRIGTSVEEVVKLSRAFEMAGMSADQMGIMVNRLQKATSGINEMGKSTGGAFAALGLDPHSLQGLDFGAQLEKLAAGFQRIHDPAERATIAMDLFGRSGGQMLMLLTKQGLLSDASADVERYAQRMADLAPKFKDAEDKLSLMKTRMNEMWAVAAEQLLPVLNTIGGVIRGLNLAPLGAALGSGGFAAIALGMSTAVVSKLEFAVMEWATSSRVGAQFAETMLLPLMSGLKTFFVAALPPLIIAAVAGALIVAIAQVILDAQNRISAIQGDSAHDTHKVAVSLGGATSSADYAARQAAGAAERDKAQKDLDALLAKQKEMADFNKGLMKTGNANAMLGQQSMSADDLARMDALKTKIDEINKLLAVKFNADRAATEAAKEANAEWMHSGENLAKITAKHQKDMIEAAVAEKDYKTALDALNAQMDALKAKKPDDATGLSKEDAAAKKAQIEADEFLLKKQIAAVEAKITEEKKKQEEHAAKIAEIDLQTKINAAKASGNGPEEERLTELMIEQRTRASLLAMGVTNETLVQQAIASARAEYKAHVDDLAIQKEQRDLEGGLNTLRQQANAIQNNYLMTDDEKWHRMRDNLTQQISKYDEYIAKLRAAYNLSISTGGTEGNVHADNIKKEIDAAMKGQTGVINEKDRQGADPTSFNQNWAKTLTNFRNEWHLTGASVSQTLGTVIGGGINSISQGLTNVIMHAKTLGEAFREIGISILTSVVQAIVQMGVQWVATRIMMAMADKMLGIASVAENAPIAIASALEWGPAATLASIATFGGADAQAPVSILGAMMATETMATADTGGFFPGQDSRVAGIFHGNEFVFSAPAVRAIGPAKLDAMHASALNGGAAGSGSGAGGKPVKVINVLDMKAAMKEARREPGYDAHIVDIMRRRKGEILET